MEWKDVITSAGLLIVVVGWLFSRWKDRNHEIFKERLKKRMDMYDAVIAATLPFLNPVDGKIILGNDELSSRLATARTKINLYGYHDEIELFEQFILQIFKQDSRGTISALEKLMPLIIEKLRRELGYRSDSRPAPHAP